MRISELLGLTWRNVHEDADEPHVIAEQVYKGKRKAKLKTDRSAGPVPLSPMMASWLAENVRNRVLRPALIEAGVARRTGVDQKGRPVYSLDGRAFHRFRHACCSLLQANGKSAVEAKDWLRHSLLSTTLGTYTHAAHDGLSDASIWDEILPVARGHLGATGHPETAATGAPGEAEKTAS